MLAKDFSYEPTSAFISVGSSARQLTTLEEEEAQLPVDSKLGLKLDKMFAERYTGMYKSHKVNAFYPKGQAERFNVKIDADGAFYENFITLRPDGKAAVYVNDGWKYVSVKTGEDVEVVFKIAAMVIDEILKVQADKLKLQKKINILAEAIEPTAEEQKVACASYGIANAFSYDW